MFQVLITLLTLCIILATGTLPAQAYLVTDDSTEDNCVPFSGEAQVTQLSNYPAEVKAADFLALADGQYLVASGSTQVGGNSTPGFKLSLRCDNLGAPQTSSVFKSEVESAGNGVITVNQSSFTSGLHSTIVKDDSNGGVTLVRTNVQGLYRLIMLLTGGPLDYPPSQHTYSNATTNLSAAFAKSQYVVDNSFRGIPEGTTIVPAVASVTVRISDDNERESSGVNKGVSTYYLHLNSESNPIMKITSTCQYTLSDGGNVDFGGQRVSQITDDRNTTIKRAMTLNMDNCYGVNKVKTYITTTATTSDSGLLLNNGVVDGAKNVAVALRVNPSYTESGNAGDNAGKDMYFDSSNPLEWNFGNSYLVTPLSKHIPLDVYLLRTGGEPTPGEYHATATIMMDFI
ncbi:fimbrial protein [Trabulsiella odontotermitis]|uniref:fimbrial protein n=1 Tax=Trabulsiella odontotermitis TaxID=379893 RepID=UPI0024B70554|nr:fimbrial protein [Trabulsiella odontotermitis]WHP33073.1 fimbrial protein [Trabulsiella odontotermitis]